MPAEKGWTSAKTMGTAVEENCPVTTASRAGKAFPMRLKMNPMLAAASPQETRKASLIAEAPFPFPPRVMFLWKTPASHSDMVMPKIEFAPAASAMAPAASGDPVTYATMPTWVTTPTTTIESNDLTTESRATRERSPCLSGRVVRRRFGPAPENAGKTCSE